MAIKLPPPPIQEKEFGNSWKQWFLKVKDILTGISSLSWELIDFTNSKISDIIDRSHNDLTSLQGGSSTERYHLTSSEYNNVVNIPIEKSLFIDTTNQTVGAINTAYAITFDSHPLTDGITIDAGKTKITVPTDGIYVFNFSAQITSTSASAKNIYFWPKINGSSVAGSTMKVTIKDSSYTMVTSRTGIFSLSAGNYLEAYWASDDTAVQLTANAATAFCPATPSVTLSIYRIQN